MSVPEVYTLLKAYIISINLLALGLFAIDKYYAKKGRWRIKESTLLWVAFLGGAAGSLLGMAAFRHKTKKKRFTILVPLFLVLQIVVPVILMMGL